MILGLVTTGEGASQILDNDKIRNLWKVVRVCRVVEAKKVSYVTLHFTPEGAKLAAFIAQVLNAEGRLIMDAPPPTPAIQDLRKVMQALGHWGPKAK